MPTVKTAKGKVRTPYTKSVGTAVKKQKSVPKVAAMKKPVKKVVPMKKPVAVKATRVQRKVGR
jgi:hypothetical protein